MKRFLLALGASTFLATPAMAHHNWAAFYDVKGDIEIEGVVSSITCRNPHVRMSFTVYGVQGSHRAIKHADGEYSIDYAEQRGAGGCVSKDLWTQMGARYPIQLLDKGDTVIVHAEEYDTIRPVRMVDDHDDPGTVMNNLGYSTGRWVGDSLLVATTFEGSNSPIQMHESFTLSADRSRLNYSQIVINPEPSDLPTVNTKWWGYVPGSFVQPYDCIG